MIFNSVDSAEFLALVKQSKWYGFTFPFNSNREKNQVNCLKPWKMCNVSIAQCFHVHIKASEARCFPLFHLAQSFLAISAWKWSRLHRIVRKYTGIFCKNSANQNSETVQFMFFFQTRWKEKKRENYASIGMETMLLHHVIVYALFCSGMTEIVVYTV